MGIFNWAMKGVHMERRVPKTAATEAVVSLQPQEPRLITEQQTVETLKPKAQIVQEMPQPIQNNNTASSPILFERQELNVNPAFSIGGHFSNALNGSTLGNRNILVITPKTNQDVTHIVSNLQNGEACIICLEEIPVAEAQRRLDFLSGVICAINGSIKPLDPNKYILTPNGLGVKN